MFNIYMYWGRNPLIFLHPNLRIPIRAIPFEKLVVGVSGAPKKNAAGWSQNGSDITAGWSAKTSDITAGWCQTGPPHYCGVVNFFRPSPFYRGTPQF